MSENRKHKTDDPSLKVVPCGITENMHTFLIISKNKTQRETHATNMSKDRNIHDFDIQYFEKEGSIGIEDIRNFQKQIMLKPIKSQQKSAIIKNAHDLTIEAQNALLKTLEEPPDNTFIFLTAETDSSLLPTILSRIFQVTLQEEVLSDTSQEIADELNLMLLGRIGDRLKLSEKLSTDKENALVWLEKAIYSLRIQMLNNLSNARTYTFVIEQFQEAHTIIKTTNVNLRFVLENLFLTLNA